LRAAPQCERRRPSLRDDVLLRARSGIRVIDVSRIDQNIARVVEQCQRTPNATVLQAYARAFPHARRI
jgi:hypothetical protein